MLYELILINEIEQRAKIIFLSVVNFDQSWVDVKFNVCNMDGKTV